MPLGPQKAVAPANAASCITEEHCMSQAHTRTLNTTSKRMVFFPSFLLMMLSDPKVTLPPGVASQAGEQRRRWFLENHSRRCNTSRAEGVPPAALQGSCTRTACNTCLESNTQWEIIVSGLVRYPHWQCPSHDKVVLLLARLGRSPH